MLLLQNEFTEAWFSWHTDRGVFSVSESMVEDDKKYIPNQKEHHRKISFGEVYKKFEKSLRRLLETDESVSGKYCLVSAPTTDVAG